MPQFRFRISVICNPNNAVGTSLDFPRHSAACLSVSPFRCAVSLLSVCQAWRPGLSLGLFAENCFLLNGYLFLLCYLKDKLKLIFHDFEFEVGGFRVFFH